MLPAQGDHGSRIRTQILDLKRPGLDPEGTRRILSVPWWDERVTDIVETPDKCDPDDPEEQVLEYARDVVSEYIRKRFPPEAE